MVVPGAVTVSVMKGRGTRSLLGGGASMLDLSAQMAALVAMLPILLIASLNSQTIRFTTRLSILAVVAAGLLVGDGRSAGACGGDYCGGGGGGGGGVATGDKRKGDGAAVCFVQMSCLSKWSKWETEVAMFVWREGVR
jgi:hypothetical protein